MCWGLFVVFAVWLALVFVTGGRLLTDLVQSKSASLKWQSELQVRTQSVQRVSFSKE